MKPHCCKIGSVIEEYNLSHGIGDGDINEYLLSRWLGRNEFPETGIRPLKNWFNQKLIKSVYQEHNRRAIESRIEAEYETLRGDDEIKKEELISDLELDGINGKQLVDSFASTSTMYRHLTNCLEGEKEKEKADPDSNWETDKVRYVQNTVSQNVSDALKSLENKDRLDRGSEAEVDVSILLSCPECDTQVRFERAVSQGYICANHRSSNGFSVDEEVHKTSKTNS